MRKLKNRYWIAFALLATLLLTACGLIAPTPDNAQILEAIAAHNHVQEEALELIYEEMQVPHRSPGKASAVIWVADKSIQKNFVIDYDKDKEIFYISGCSTLLLGEDGVYRDE